MERKGGGDTISPESGTSSVPLTVVSVPGVFVN